MICGGCPSLLGLEVGGGSYSNFLSSTVLGVVQDRLDPKGSSQEPAPAVQEESGDGGSSSSPRTGSPLHLKELLWAAGRPLQNELTLAPPSIQRGAPVSEIVGPWGPLRGARVQGIKSTGPRSGGGLQWCVSTMAPMWLLGG